jgi:XTP/dITP diphosphohydrolase
MNDVRLLVLGTHNRKKGRELEQLLAPYRFELQTLEDFPQSIKVVEDGQTFAENACLKAGQQAAHLGKWVLGEDSGLCVDALNGEPGIYSARFAGADATDADNNKRLLEEMRNVPIHRRAAHYVCHIALADPSGAIRLECTGRCHGRIADKPHGESGFGYDPLFEVPEYHQTFAQLGDTVKSVLSHRSRALQQFLPQFVRLAAQTAW